MAGNSADRPMYRYTTFPNLCVDAPPAPNSGKPAKNMTEFRVHCKLSAESVIMSWAQLLRGYTGVDDVVFRVDSEIVGINFLDGSVEYLPEGSVQVTEGEGAGQRCSGVYFETPPAAQWPQIHLRVHLPLSTISIVASAAILPTEHMESLASQLLHVLLGNNTASVLAPSAPYSGGLSILNPSPTKLPGPELLHQLIAFGRYGNNTALDFLHADGIQRVSYSYKQLDCLSTQFAVTLLERLPSGRGGSTVPVLLPPSPELYVALIGILKAGATFVPLNLDAPTERIRFVTADVGAAVIVTQSSFSAVFTWEGCPPVVLTDGGRAVASRHELELPADIKPSALAYIMYTSGSTGTPKGVAISHSAATQSLLAHDRHIPALRRFLQFAAPTFDVFVFEVFFPLFRGGTLVGCDRGRLLANLPAVINELNIDVAELTPTVAGGLIVDRGAVPGLKALLTIGEMLTRHVVDQFGDGVLQGMYGPTEAAIHCTLATGFKKSWKVGDIGVPLDTVSAFILSVETIADSGDVTVLPLGWVGELAVGGYQLADGYLNQPELTREAFIESKLYGRLYRTGDRARILPDGRIECLGRVTAGQIKLRGQRIELGEVEQVVMKVPGVKAAIASMLESKLVVYVGGGAEKGTVYATCKRWLPKFMMPGDIVVFDELPRLSSGKADRKRLDKVYLGMTRVPSGNHVTEQMGDMDQVVANIVEALLGIRPSKQESLVAQGLDSIQAIRLVTALRSKGFRIEVVDVLKADCIEGIATAMSPTEIGGPNYHATEIVTAHFKAVREAEELEILLRRSDEIEDIIPCTSVQEAMLAETAKDPKAYCNWILLELPVKFCASEIETAFRRVIDSNEILRTGFTALGSGFAQVVWKYSRPGQFSEADKVQGEWEVSSLERLLEPPFEVSLIRGEGKSQLIMRLHHAVYDGWCLEQILSDFSTSLSRSPLPVRPQFRQVVGYELSRSKDLESSRRSWAKALEGVSVSRLPNFHSHTDARSGVFTEALSLRDSRERYEAAARIMGVSPQVIIQTAWAYLLSFYTGSPDVVFGTVASGRTIALDGIEDILGPTIHTLPVRVQLGLGKMLREVVGDVHASNRLLLEHSGLSLREIRKACGIEGALFDSLLVWQQTLRGEEERGLVWQVDSRDQLEMPLLVEIEPRPDTINVKATYQHALLPHAQVRLLLRQLDQLVFGIISQPGSNLDLVLGFLQEDVLSVENPHPSPSATSGVTSLAELVELTAAAKPHTFALEFASKIIDGAPDSVKLSYAELNMRANKLAHRLISFGVLPGELVCVCMEKSPALYISILAILKAGAGYLPLTPETPKERMAQILENAEVKLCLADDPLGSSGIPEGVHVVLADNVEIEGYIDTNPVVERSDGALAYAVFTSGSTGVPKGVLIENANIVDNILALKGLYPTNDDSKILQFCSVAFDVSVFDIFFAWSTGICLCSGTKDFLLRDLAGAINALDITHLSMTPTVAALVNPGDVPRVEFLVTAGEAVTQKVFQNWAGKGLFQGYGPSETVNICTVRPSVRDTDHINNIGPPLSNTSAFVILGYDDDEFRLAPRGGVGEFCFGGAQVGRGYLKMPELTNRKFISHPKYGRLYRSGDIGRMLIDGSLEFVGRQDDQVKIRGYRIELGEINSALLRSRSVNDTITIPLRGRQSDGHQLVAFAVLERMQSESLSLMESSEEAKQIVNELFSSLAGILPSYMIPTAIIPLTRMPMTTQGKIDKTRLRSLYFDLGGGVLESYTESYSAGQSGQDWTALERMVADIIADVARVTTGEVGRTTSIFRLGLDSISVIQLSSGIAKAGHIRLDVSQIMRNPTPAALATLLITQQPGAIPRKTQSGGLEKFAAEVESSVLGQLKCSADDVQRILPCTPLQEAMLSQKEGTDPSLYYNHTVLSLGADPARIRDSWAVMVEKQDIMRTCFCVTSHPRHAFAQVVLKHHQLPWAIFQVETASEIPGLIGERIATISESFTITKPPYGFSLFQSPTKTTLIMHFHHSLYDGFAMNLLLDDVRRAYHGQGLPARGSFESFLEYIENLDLVAADGFWGKFLDGLEPSSFPDLTGKATAARGYLRGMVSTKAFCSRSLASIDKGCRELSTSLLALGQAAWVRLLSVYSGETDLCFGNVVSGRTIPVEGVEGIISPCFNTVPIRIRVTPGATNESVMERLRLINAEVLPFQLTPLRRIMTTLRTEGQRLFDTLFILQHAHKLPSAEELWKVDADYGEMDFSIVVELVPDRGKSTLEINLHFRRDVLLERDAHVLLQQLDDAIISSLDEPPRPALDFRGFDRTHLSYANSRPADIPGDVPGFLHSEFERHSHENPSRGALEYLDKDGEIIVWTFEELNWAANQVAHYLMSNGVRRDEAVPLCLEKSPLFYICVLGVLKAGAAFTPIDPSLPPQRKLFMLGELGARIVLATELTALDLAPLEGIKLVDAGDADVFSSQPTINPKIEDLSAQCLAYRLYTSGSTGQPKAVSVEIGSAVQTLRASKSIIPWNDKSRLLQFAATTFDMCYYDCFMAWSYGFTLCSADKSHLLDDLEGTIQSLRATILDLTPTVASTLRAANLPEVELLYCIGEAMPQKLASDWDGRCVNSYGPTEAAMCCTISPTRKDIKSSNIGKPFPTASFFILSREGTSVVPVFGSGELCIGGPQLAREYHNNPERTANSFIDFEGSRVYRTGDLVRMLANGTFVFIGRTDDQVKIRGLRVELDEINSVLRGSGPLVKDAATIVTKRDGNSKEQLVTFLALRERKHHGTAAGVLKHDSQLYSVLELSRDTASSKLPRYMVPGVILIINHIPLSAAGKIDKRALVALFNEQDIQSFASGAANTQDEDETAWAEDERKIRDAFARISQVPVEQISRHSTIYEIGLDSISASQVAMQLKRVGLKVSVMDILERPSIAKLYPILKDISGRPTDPSEGLDAAMARFADRFLEPICKETSLLERDITGVYPCTPVQEGMLSQFIRSNGTLYFNHTIFKLPSDTNLARLKDSWEMVFKSLDILRTGFVGVDDSQHSFAMIVHKTGPASLPWFVLSTGEDLEGSITERKRLNSSFALERLHLPPWMLSLFRVPGGEYLMMLSAHHAMYDAQSLGTILNSVACNYSGQGHSLCTRFSGALGEIVKHCTDDQTIADDRVFWKKKLEGSTISRFPNLCPLRVKSDTEHASSITAKWSLSKIERACRRLGVSVNATGQAAWARILSAYLGEDSVTMGVVMSGRSGIPDSQDVVFPFIVTLPLLCSLTGTNRELVLSIQGSNSQVLKHQHTPLRSVQRWLGHPKQSLFDTIFVYQKSGPSRYKPALRWETMQEDAFVDYSISLELEPTGNDSLLIRATCKDNIIPQEQTKLLLQQFEAAFIEILEAPDASSSDFHKFPAALLSCTPAKEDEIPTSTHLLHKFVEDHRRLTANKIAFEFAASIVEGYVVKETWTYTQLDEEGNKVANYLLNNGVNTGDIVGICFEKCPEASFAILGILKSGCAFVALDYSAPIDRKSFIITDSGAKHVLTMDKYMGELGKLGINVVSLETDVRVKASSPKTPEIADLRPNDLCYCLYTSGTTGIPKGCEITHENAVQAMLAFQRLFSGHWDAESRFLQFASFHFDVSVLEQFWSWSVGICVTSAPRDLIFQDLALTIRELRITHLDLTPSLAALIKPEDVPSLCKGVFITGGEQLKQEILDAWGETGCIYNGYGPTEVTIGCTMYPRVPATGKPSNIGPQFDNVGSFVLAPGTDRPVLRGAIGELCVSGKLVGRGYLNRPSLTQERFPHLEMLGPRVYRTGDFVRIFHDNTFDFAGRADDQVKLRGQRLEIGEINETLKQATGRARAVATLVLRHPKQQRDQLVSFVELETSGYASRSDIRVLDSPEEYSEVIRTLADACKRKLPAYMIPTRFLPISAIPLSVNNKVDNKKLKDLYHETSLEILQRISRGDDAQEGEWSDAERQIRDTVAGLANLEIPAIKRSATVFELGLDSVSIVGLARHLKRAGFPGSSVSLIMQHPTLGELAAELAKDVNSGSHEFTIAESVKQNLVAFANKNTSDVYGNLSLDPGDIELIAPCTALQEGMIVRFLDSEKPLYYNSFPMLLNATTDVNALCDAWRQVIASTGILRTCFCETPDGYAQVVLKDPKVPWEEVSILSKDIQATISGRMGKHANNNKDLHRVPLYFLLLRTPERAVLVLNIFHALYDGNSLPLILGDVQRAYYGKFMPRSRQFAEVVGHLLSVDIGGAREFWKKALAESTLSRFPRLSAAPPTDTDYMIKLNSRAAARGVEGICKKVGCTPQAIFLAAWASVISQYLGPRPIFGVVVSGLSIPLDGIESIIGPLFNTIPFTLSPQSALSWEELIRQAHAFYSGSIPYHHTPLHLINKWMHASAGKPLFDSLFVYQRNNEKNLDLPSLWETLDTPVTADYPLALEVEQSTGGLSFSIVSRESLMSKTNSSELLERLEGQIQNIIHNPSQKPSVVAAVQPVAPPSSMSATKEPGGDQFSWGPEAEILRQIISTLAEVEESVVTPDSSIFELGLDSIEAIKLSSRLRRRNINLSVSDIMRNPTIRKLDLFLRTPSVQPKEPTSQDRLAEFETHIRKAWNPQTHNWREEEIEAIYPTTPLQEAMLAKALASDYKLYFNHEILELEPWVDLQRLRDAWATVARCSEILRTTFFNATEMLPGSPCTFGQLVHKQSELLLDRVDMAANGDLEKVLRAVMQRAIEGVDMMKEPPIKVTVVHDAKSRYLVLSISHALYDGWSIGLLHNDVRSAYYGLPTKRPSCRIILENIYRGNRDDTEKFWKQALAGASVSSLPTIQTGAPQPATHRIEALSALPFSEVRSFCKRVGVTVQSLGQMCWALALAHSLGEPDVMFGTVLSGRDFDSADEIMFPAMNTVPVRALIRGTYKEMLQYMQDNSANVTKYQYTSLRQIQRLVDSSGQSLFDTLFIYQRSHEVLDDKHKALWHSVDGASDVEYNVCIEMERSGDGLIWRTACKSTILTLEDAGSLLQMLDLLMVDIVGNPDRSAILYQESGMSFGNLPATAAQRSSRMEFFNGRWVDLGKVESAAKASNADIRDSGALIVEENGKKLLALFIKCSDPVPVQSLAESLRQCLPHWSMPSFIIPTRRIHRTNADSRVDRAELASEFSTMAPEFRLLSTVRSSDEWAALEVIFRDVISKVSGIPETEVGRHQTIFHLGLDSISAILLSNELRKRSIFLSVTEILHAATIENMAAIVKTAPGGAPQSWQDTKVVLENSLAGIGLVELFGGIGREAIERVFPATAGQHYMLSAWKNSGFRLFMPTFSFKCRRVGISCVLSGWESLVRQEPILRTIFIATQNEDTPLTQLVLRSPQTQYEWYESSSSRNDTLIRFLVSQEQKKPVDLSLPPVRLCILNTPTETLLFLTIHHALYDGVSLPILLTKFEGFLNDCTGRLPTPGPEGLGFPTVVASTLTRNAQNQRDFWTRYLGRGVSTPVPAKHPDVGPEARIEVYRPGALGEISVLEGHCRREGVSLQSVFLAAFAKVYAHWYYIRDGPLGRDRVVIFGIYVSNRHLPIPGLDSLAAPTLNIIPLRIREPRGTPVMDLSRKIQNDLIEIGDPENTVVPLWQIEKWTGARVDCFFNYLKVPEDLERSSAVRARDQIVLEEFKVDVEAEDCTLDGSEFKGNASMDNIKTNLDIEVAVRGDNIDIGVFSSTKYLDQEDAKLAIDQICTIVKAGLGVH